MATYNVKADGTKDYTTALAGLTAHPTSSDFVIWGGGHVGSVGGLALSNITITANPGDESQGTSGESVNGPACFYSSAANTPAFTSWGLNDFDYVTVEDILIVHGSRLRFAPVAALGASRSNQRAPTLKRCSISARIWDYGPATRYPLLSLRGYGTGSDTGIVENCRIEYYSSNHGNRDSLVSVTQAIVRNCTAVDFTGDAPSGILIGDDRVTVQNCCVAGTSTEDYDDKTHTFAELSNCISEDGTVSTVNATVRTDCIASVAVANMFTDWAAKDVTPLAGGTLGGAGKNLYATFTDDFYGDTRPASGAWDVGFMIAPAASGPSEGTLSLLGAGR